MVAVDLEPRPEKESPWPLSSRQACQVLQVFPVDVWMPGVGRGDEGRKRGWNAGSGALGSLRSDLYPLALL